MQVTPKPTLIRHPISWNYDLSKKKWEPTISEPYPIEVPDNWTEAWIEQICQCQGIQRIDTPCK